jgi:hypothetical protein
MNPLSRWGEEGRKGSRFEAGKPEDDSFSYSSKGRYRNRHYSFAGKEDGISALAYIPSSPPGR